jgi:putative ABC transport system permease protein
MSARSELSKLQNLFQRANTTGDLEEEISVHLLMQEQENREAGMSAEEAHYSARRQFGNVARAMERSREMWSWRFLEVLGQDVRYGLRQLRSNKGFALIAVLTFALGIGATTAVFSVVNGVLLQPLPFEEPGQLVDLRETEVAPGDYPLSGPDYADWQAQNRTLAGSALYEWPRTVNASGSGEPVAATVVHVQANLFRVLGVRPMAGRDFSAGEDMAGRNQVVILSYGFWQRHFGGAPALGAGLVLDGKTYTVVGVMPRGFRFVMPADLWSPIDMGPDGLGIRGDHSFNGVARLKPGVTLAAARADLLAISQRLEKQFPDSNEKVHAILTPLDEKLTGHWKTPLLILLGAVVLVLLIACVNVANLQLARASTRHREMAVRASLGAGRGRLIRQMLTESVLLALVGAAIGVAFAYWCVQLLPSLKSLPIPRVKPIGVDGTVLLFASGVSVLAGVLFGLAPALQFSERSLNSELRAGTQSVVSAGHGRQLLRDGLVVVEIALTLALLTSAGLLLRSFAHVRNTETGVDSRNVLTAAFNLPDATYPDATSRRRFYDQLLARLTSSPAVEAAALSTEIPMRGGSNGYIKVDGDTDPALAHQLVGWNFITPGYFRALHIRVLKGRGFGDADIEQAAVNGQKLASLFKSAQGQNLKVPPDIVFPVVISQATERAFWKGQDAVGRVFDRGGVKSTVIGVVSDVKEYGVRAKIVPQAYFPLTEALAFGGGASLVLKTRIDPEAVIPALRKEAKQLDATLAPDRLQTLDEVIAEDAQDVSFQAFLLGSFAALALVLAAIGLYGVMSYLVNQRTREIGIRMALGAERRSVLSLIMLRGVRLTLLGMLIGSAAAVALGRAMSSVLFGVNATDPATLGAVSVLLVGVALAACLIPARRATRVEPILALRYD